MSLVLLDAFGSNPLPVRVGLLAEPQDAGSFFPTWDSPADVALQEVASSPIPEDCLPSVLHVTIGGPAHSSAHLWEDHAEISRIHLFSDTDARTAAPAQDISAI